MEKVEIDAVPPYVGCVIATSTGGPPTLIQFFKNIQENIPAAFFIVQHGPTWMLETFAQRLQRETKLKVNIGKNGMETKVGNIYIAPGDYHMRINLENQNVELDNGPKENFVRPAADPLFRSAAKSFGKYLVAVTLTGLGRDASQGAGIIKSAGGFVLVQDPDTAVAPSMPRTVIESGFSSKVVKLDKLAPEAIKSIKNLDSELKKAKSKNKK